MVKAVGFWLVYNKLKPVFLLLALSVGLKTVKLETAHGVMGGFFYSAMISSQFILFLNHLLSSDAKARALVQAHAHKQACIDIDAVQISVCMGADGYFQASHAEQKFDLTITIKWTDLPLLLQNRSQAMSYAKIDGDAQLANMVSQLSEQLRWDVEADLARVVGDIAALRLHQFGKNMLKTAQERHQSMRENVAEYFLEENPMLMRNEPVQAFSAQVIKTRDDVERLIKRLEKLEKIEKMKKAQP